MESVLARCSVSISELKKKPSAHIEQSGGEPVAILNQNKPAAKCSMFDWPGPKMQGAGRPK